MNFRKASLGVVALVITIIGLYSLYFYTTFFTKTNTEIVSSVPLPPTDVLPAPDFPSVDTGTSLNATSDNESKCSENVFDEIRTVVNSDEIKTNGGININGNFFYKAKASCLYPFPEGDCTEKAQMEQLKIDESQVRKKVASTRFNVVNGCLYKGENRLLERKLLQYLFETDFFGIKHPEGMRAEYLDEWFRFDDRDKTYIYLIGAAGCGGCIAQGPHLIINKETATVTGRIADMFPPVYISNSDLSSDKKFFVGTDVTEDSAGKPISIKLWLYDLVRNERIKLLYKIPEDKTILGLGHGVYSMSAITWKNDSKISIQLYEKGDEFGGYAKMRELTLPDGTTRYEAIKSGDPVVINVK